MRADIPVGLQLLFGSNPICGVEDDCTSDLVIEVFDDSNKVGADLVLFYGCPKNCMPNPVGGLSEVY